MSKRPQARAALGGGVAGRGRTWGARSDVATLKCPLNSASTTFIDGVVSFGCTTNANSALGAPLHGQVSVGRVGAGSFDRVLLVLPASF